MVAQRLFSSFSWTVFLHQSQAEPGLWSWSRQETSTPVSVKLSWKVPGSVTVTITITITWPEKVCCFYCTCVHGCVWNLFRKKHSPCITEGPLFLLCLLDCSVAWWNNLFSLSLVVCCKSTGAMILLSIFNSKIHVYILQQTNKWVWYGTTRCNCCPGSYDWCVLSLIFWILLKWDSQEFAICMTKFL